MRAGMIGRKLGMTRMFTEDGKALPVTVIQLGPCQVIGTMNVEKNGYNAIQLGFEEAKPSRVGKAVKGLYAKANTTPKKVLKEFHVADPLDYAIGQVLTVDQFVVNGYVDVTGMSIGKGFAGVMKRWGFRGGRASHGAHKTHRSAGSIGQCQDPGRVFKNKKMAGQMGNDRVTVQNLQVALVDTERNLLLVHGGIPGSRGGTVLVRDAIKKGDQNQKAEK